METIVLGKQRGPGSKISLGGVFHVTCYDKEGKLKWVDTAPNIVVNEGLQHILDVTFNSGVAKTSIWYVGLGDSNVGSAGATGTAAGHGNWNETTGYSEAVRQVFTDVRTNQTVSNTASAAAFSIDASDNIGGAFLSSDSNKATTAGVLLCVAAFTEGTKAVDSGDTVNVSYQFTAQDVAT